MNWGNAIMHGMPWHPVSIKIRDKYPLEIHFNETETLFSKSAVTFLISFWTISAVFRIDIFSFERLVKVLLRQIHATCYKIFWPGVQFRRSISTLQSWAFAIWITGNLFVLANIWLGHDQNVRTFDCTIKCDARVSRLGYFRRIFSLVLYRDG